jgi:hypothetical protein
VVCASVPVVILDLQLNLVCEYFIENFCFYINQRNRSIIFFLSFFLSFFVMYLFYFSIKVILYSWKEVVNVPSLFISYNNLRRAGVGSPLKVVEFGSEFIRFSALLFGRLYYLFKCTVYYRSI